MSHLHSKQVRHFIFTRVSKSTNFYKVSFTLPLIAQPRQIKPHRGPHQNILIEIHRQIIVIKNNLQNLLRRLRCCTKRLDHVCNFQKLGTVDFLQRFDILTSRSVSRNKLIRFHVFHSIQSVQISLHIIKEIHMILFNNVFSGQAVS